ncbi:transketolase family protein [Peribacillus castrilensis]|uniref:Transketolase-like pyrimidine-binding domain-containing protein n=1 Tax=Peribacillus simplex TaxID=1478 RepID=A0AAN2PEM4_9BACI|nr:MULTISPECIES: transketolase family protein [Bacillaceae]MCP1093781.1 transketolase family protein [Bacillaceae bacterium OS4b]MBD8586949.1 transketolase family protein [Peribacillus simplex]MCF7621135.1 transketolase family protein [Peribacillus frigoritolerans]MCP1151785.1 transketolase family protein [Peribacillus frigoritolerans]MCT1386803.1 transketolase family protein [Peribacillus frigoritolerans]
MANQEAPRKGFADALIRLGEKHDNLVVLDADCAKSNMTNLYKNRFPERFFNIGISECDLVGTAAGMAVAGKVPFANAYANFLTGRAFDQMRISVCYSNNNVKIVGHNAGTSAAQEGATHLPLEDISLMRSLPRMTVIVPADAVEMEKAVEAAYYHEGPIYLRVGKLPVPIVTKKEEPFKIGKAIKYREGSDITIISTGIMLDESLKAAGELEKQGVSAELLHIHTIKPIDKEAIIASAAKTKHVITVEEHSIIGGLGSAVAEVLSESQPAKLRRIGTNDRFGVSGKMDELLDLFELRAHRIISTANELLGHRVTS